MLFRTSTVRDIAVTPFNVNVPFDDLSTKDNAFLDFQSAAQFKVLDSVKLVKNFNIEAWFASTIEQQYRQAVRDIVKTKTMTEIMTDPLAAKEIDDKVTAELVRLVKESGLPMQVLGVTLGRARPNASVLSEMDQTAAQQQRKKTLVEAKLAEDSRRESEEARAIADNAYRNKMGLDPQQFIELERIKRYSEACSKSGHCIVSSGQANVMVGK
jgi:regulator of protease activity HflC (stomatin/prohibitin superfamily)